MVKLTDRQERLGGSSFGTGTRMVVERQVFHHGARVGRLQVERARPSGRMLCPPTIYPVGLREVIPPVPASAQTVMFWHPDDHRHPLPAGLCFDTAADFRAAFAKAS